MFAFDTMDFLTFLSIVLPAVLPVYAWPLVLLLVVLLFKKPVEKRLNEIKSVTWKHFIVRFSSRLGRVRKPKPYVKYRFLYEGNILPNKSRGSVTGFPLIVSTLA